MCNSVSRKKMPFVTFSRVPVHSEGISLLFGLADETVLFFMLEIRQIHKPNIDIHLFFRDTLVFDKIIILNLNVTL